MLLLSHVVFVIVTVNVIIVVIVIVKGENGIGTKGEKGDAANMDPRQRANWKQCAWKRNYGTKQGKIQVSYRIRYIKVHG